MNQTLTILGAFLIGIALRSCKTKAYRKLGAVAYLILTGVVAYLLSHSVIVAILSMAAWFLFPLVQVLWKMKPQDSNMQEILAGTGLAHLKVTNFSGIPKNAQSLLFVFVNKRKSHSHF